MPATTESGHSDSFQLRPSQLAEWTLRARLERGHIRRRSGVVQFGPVRATTGVLRPEIPVHRFLVIFMLGCVLCALPVAAQTPAGSRLDDIIKSGKLRVCSPGDYKPFSFLRTDGSYEGLDIDLVQSAARSLGVDIVMVKAPWP